MARNKIDLDDLKSAVSDNAVMDDPRRKRTTDYLGHRQNSLANLAQVENRKTIWVEPQKCRLWDAHDRDYAALDETTCQDLIDGFLSEGKQKFPAIVRPSKDPNYEWEIVCGARRHWTVKWLREHNHPEFLFLIEPRSLTDEEAFRLSDIENRDKLDLNDYERAQKYWKAINVYHYYSTQKDMAQRIRMDETYLSRFLQLAELPEVVVYAFTPRELKVEHVKAIAPLLKREQTKQALIEKANAIREEQKQRGNENKPLLPGARVAALLQQVAVTPRNAKASAENVYWSENGKKIATAKKGRGSVIDVRITHGGSTKTEVMAALTKMVDELMG